METQTPDEQHTQGSAERDNPTVSRQDVSIQAYPSTESNGNVCTRTYRVTYEMCVCVHVHVHVVCVCVTSHFLSNTGDEVNDVNGLQLCIWVFIAGVQVNIKVCRTVCDVSIQCDLLIISSTTLHDVTLESELSDIEDHNISNTSTYMPSSSP